MSDPTGHIVTGPPALPFGYAGTTERDIRAGVDVLDEVLG